MPVYVPPVPCRNCHKVLRNGNHSFKCGMDGSLIEYDWDDNLKTFKAYKKRLPSSASEPLYECPYGVPFKSTEKESGIIKRFRQSVFRLVSGKHKEKGLPSPSIPQKIRKQPSTTILSSNKGRALSEQDIKYLIEKAQSCVDLRDFEQAVFYYTMVIENAFPHSQFFTSRGCAYAGIALLNRFKIDLEKAIEDINIAIENNPDEGENYWRKGAFLTYNLSIEENLSSVERKRLLKEIVGNYKISIEKEPINPLLWLDIIEINIMLRRWDDAIGYYGECRPYITSKEHKLIRAWLGCIALILADDSVQEDDLKPLHDHSVRLDKSHWYVGNISSFFQEINLTEEFISRCKKAKEIHKIFITHFDESIW